MRRIYLAVLAFALAAGGATAPAAASEQGQVALCASKVTTKQQNPGGDECALTRAAVKSIPHVPSRLRVGSH